MGMISDILLAAGAFGAGVYCFVLARRLKNFTDLDKGVGGAVAVLATQVEDLKSTLEQAQQTAGNSSESLKDLTTRAEAAAKKLELMVASIHDLPAGESAATAPSTEPVFARRSAGVR